MLDELYPIVVTPIISEDGNQISFLRQDNKITISFSDVSLVWKILGQCNGYNTIQDISKQIQVPEDIIKVLIKELERLQILVDSRKQYLHFHRISNYPTGYYRRLTKEEIYAYMEKRNGLTHTGRCIAFSRMESALDPFFLKRRSCRRFSQVPISVDLIGSICYYGYSIHEHHVPSGGGLYPLKIYVLVEMNQEGMPVGYYEYDAENDNLVLFYDTVDKEQLMHCFNSEELAYGSSVQIVIAADLGRQTYKYGNRGYRLTLLEAGHVAENICLFCSEKNLGTCELGGLLDEPLRTELKMDNEIYPLLAIAIGYVKEGSNNNIDEMAFLERHQLPYFIEDFGNECSFFGAGVPYLYRDGSEDVAGATAASLEHAVFKAGMEAFERQLSSNARVNYEGTAKQLTEGNKQWLGIDQLAPLTITQTRQCGLAQFTLDLPIQWTEGFSYSKRDIIYVPTDVVYYGHLCGANRVCISNSSGIAAHTDKNSARTNALTELLERDAIMRCWYYQMPPQKLVGDILPVHIRKRISYWERNGRTVYVMDVPSVYAKVILVAIVSKDYPCFVCGASATLTDSYESFSRVINKALQEAEYCLYSYMKCPESRNIDLTEVKTPRDHGKIYHFPEYLNTLKWLWNGRICRDLSHFHPLTFNELASILDLIEVDLSNVSMDLYVVKMLSPKVIPISFGYYNTYYTHPAVGECNLECLQYPHFFA